VAEDPFTAPGHSTIQLTTPVSQSWVHEITVIGDKIDVQETIARPDGSEIMLAVRATLDDTESPVNGSPVIGSGCSLVIPARKDD